MLLEAHLLAAQSLELLTHAWRQHQQGRMHSACSRCWCQSPQSRRSAPGDGPSGAACQRALAHGCLAHIASERGGRLLPQTTAQASVGVPWDSACPAAWSMHTWTSQCCLIMTMLCVLGGGRCWQACRAPKAFCLLAAGYGLWALHRVEQI